MTASTDWSAYMDALGELDNVRREWIDGEQNSDAIQRSAIESADRNRARNASESASRQSGLQELLDEGRTHLRSIGQDDLLPKRVPSGAGPAGNASDDPRTLLKEVAVLAESMFEQRRGAELQRLQAESDERQRKAAEEATAAQRKALRVTLLKISGGAAVALGAIVILRTLTGL